MPFFCFPYFLLLLLFFFLVLSAEMLVMSLYAFVAFNLLHMDSVEHLCSTRSLTVILIRIGVLHLNSNILQHYPVIQGLTRSNLLFYHIRLSSFNNGKRNFNWSLQRNMNPVSNNMLNRKSYWNYWVRQIPFFGKLL